MITLEKNSARMCKILHSLLLKISLFLFGFSLNTTECLLRLKTTIRNLFYVHKTMIPNLSYVNTKLIMPTKKS